MLPNYFLTLAFILLPISSHALDLTTTQLPLEYHCKQTAAGGLALDEKSGRWRGQAFKEEQFSFVLTISRFEAKEPETKRRCGLAITASGLAKDDYSAFKRENGRDLCATLDINDRSKFGLSGPIIYYCEVGGYELAEIRCIGQNSSFGFSSRSLLYFDEDPISLPFSAKLISISTGVCARN